MVLYVTGVAVTNDVMLTMSCEDDDEIVTLGEKDQLNWLEAKVAEKARSSKTLTDNERMVKEMDKYMAEPNLPEGENPNNWRATHKLRYPSVANIARMYLAVPATSIEAREYLKMWMSVFGPTHLLGSAAC